MYYGATNDCLLVGEGDPGGGVSTGQHSAMRETIFSAEIRSVEYEKPGLDEGNQRETVLFDDIGKTILSYALQWLEGDFY